MPLVLAQVADVIELAGLQIGTGRADLGQRRLGENFGDDVLDRAISDFVDEADISAPAEAMREMTPRPVTSGSTIASRPRRP
jgi:hypothetical protein